MDEVMDYSRYLAAPKYEVLEKLMLKQLQTREEHETILDDLKWNPELLRATTVFHAAMAHNVSAGVLVDWLQEHGPGPVGMRSLMNECVYSALATRAAPISEISGWLDPFFMHKMLVNGPGAACEGDDTAAAVALGDRCSGAAAVPDHSAANRSKQGEEDQENRAPSSEKKTSESPTLFEYYIRKLGAYDVARLLLKLHPQLTENVYLFHTAMRFAAPRDILEQFYSTKGVINARAGTLGVTALHVAVNTPHINPQIIDDLIKNGADPTIRNNKNRLPIHTAIEARLSIFQFEIPDSIIKPLLTEEFLKGATEEERQNADIPLFDLALNIVIG